MGIPFNEIPEGLLVPGHYQEVDMSLAGGGSDKKIVLLIGQMLSTGVAVEGKEYPLTSAVDARALFGEGAALTITGDAFIEQNMVEEIRAIGIKDKADGIAAIWKVTFALNNHEAGTVPLYVDGRGVSFGLKETDDLATVRNNAMAAFNALFDGPAEASAGVADGEMVVTHNHKGEIGNALDLRLALFNESLPAGVTVTIEKTTAGSGNPDVATAISGMQEIRYNYMLSQIHDAANMVKLEAELDRRYTALVQKGCRMFIALSGEESVLTAYADANRNNPHVSVLVRGENPESEPVWLGRGAALIIRRLADDPSANINGQELKLIASKALDFDTRQRLLEKGIATYTVGGDGKAYVERQVTMYTEDKDGNRDTAYLDIQIPETIDAIREFIRTKCAKEYAEYKLAKTNENFGTGSKVMTPSIFRSFLLETYQQDFILDKQWCQDFSTYKETLIVTASTVQDKTRIDYRHRPQLIGQFLIGAGVLQAQ